jgi:hypothetical protein
VSPLRGDVLKGIVDMVPHSISHVKSIEIFCANKDVFLFALKPNNQELQLFHHGDILGGSRLSPISIYVALLGEGPTALAVEIQESISFTKHT